MTDAVISQYIVCNISNMTHTSLRKHWYLSWAKPRLPLAAIAESSSRGQPHLQIWVWVSIWVTEMIFEGMEVFILYHCLHIYTWWGNWWRNYTVVAIWEWILLHGCHSYHHLQPCVCCTLIKTELQPWPKLVFTLRTVKLVKLLKLLKVREGNPRMFQCY